MKCLYIDCGMGAAGDMLTAALTELMPVFKLMEDRGMVLSMCLADDERQIAQMADIKPVTVEKIEAGAFNVTFDIIARVADVLSCEVTLMEK